MDKAQAATLAKEICSDVMEWAECVEVMRDSHGGYYVAASGYGLEKTFDSFEGWRGFAKKQEDGIEEDTYEARFEVDALYVMPLLRTGGHSISTWLCQQYLNGGII